LKDKKRGNSDYRDRIELLKKYIATFGLESIECVIGDREFIGKDWIEWLEQQQIPYVLRIKENGQYIGKRNAKMVKAASLFKALQAGQIKYVGKRQVGKTDSYWSHITALKTTTHQLVVLLHSPHIQQPCQVYRRRWEIELLFKVMKTSGFDLEATHISEADRLETLLAIVGISCCFAYRIGIYCIIEKPPKIKKKQKHGTVRKIVSEYRKL
jgi:transposase